VDWTLEVVVIPVADVDRAKHFYLEQLGFNLDVDHQTEDFRVVQLTPPGSACSISLMRAETMSHVSDIKVVPGSVQGLHLCVTDIVAAHAELTGRGVQVSGVFHFGPNGKQDGPHPERLKFGSYLSFSDPDGNGWVVQEVTRDGDAA
jgi:catechol 2,3-dioxygenase-like lactoylglutathione lyase family enzyme